MALLLETLRLAIQYSYGLWTIDSNDSGKQTSLLHFKFYDLFCGYEKSMVDSPWSTAMVYGSSTVDSNNTGTGSIHAALNEL